MKWKLNIRKEVRVVVALLGVSLLIAFTERHRGSVLCRNITIELDNEQENHFMDEADVSKLVESGDQTIRGTSIEHIDLKDIEGKLKVDKHIKDAQLFGDLKGNLVVHVELRRPIARIVQEDAPDTYIADDGTLMPVSDKFTARVLLISGPFVKKLMENDDLNNMEEGRQLLDLIRMINEDSFWKAQVAQLDMNNAGKVTMYPQVTGQLVEFGRAEDIERKFKKLMIFYKEILPQRGWTRYKRVNLEYEGQVIAE